MLVHKVKEDFIWNWWKVGSVLLFKASLFAIGPFNYFIDVNARFPV